MNLYIHALKKWGGGGGGGDGLHLSIVPFIHLSFYLSELFCSLH